MMIRPAYMIWQPRLSLFWGGVLLAAVSLCMFIIYLRMRRRYTGSRLLLLVVPKLLIALLLVLLFFDPAWAMTRRVTEDLRFLVLIDQSSSMDVIDRDGIARFERAHKVKDALRRRLPGAIKLDVLLFEDYIREGAALAAESEEARPTDLAQVILDAERRRRGGDWDGIVFLTDGGDERFRPDRVPPVPMYFMGIGAEPGRNNDLEISSVDVPSTVELNADFDLEVGLRAYGDTAFIRQLYSLSLELQKRSNDGDRWATIASRRVDLRRSPEDVRFTVGGIDAEGRYEMRVLLEEMPGEMTYLNNERHFTVNIVESELHVLLYTRMLGRNEAVLHRALEADAGVELTSIMRITGDRYVVKSGHEEEYLFLEEGFPDSPEGLRPFNAVIVGSFPAEDWTAEQMHALAGFVEEGGAAVFLGGEDSFGRGGYADTPLSPLFPWAIRADEPELAVTRVGVTVTSAVVRQDVIRGWAEKMRAAHPQHLYSINRPGRLKRGAVSLLNAAHDDRDVAVLALQPYGLGRVLGVATNTLWRWYTAGDEERAAYEHFWRHGIRYLTGMEDGGRLLRVRFDRDRYYPGEMAVMDILTIGDYAEGQLVIEALRVSDGDTENLFVQRQPGRAQEFRCRTVFPGRGRYNFIFRAFVDNEELETYTKEMWVGSHLNEGANIYVDHGFLSDLAARSGGAVFREDESEQLADKLQDQLVKRMVHRTEPLLQFRGIYLALIVLVLLTEWTLRRRMDLF